MERQDADVLVEHLLGMSFDAGLRVISAEMVGLPARPLLLVMFEDEPSHRGQPLGAWWDFSGYGEYRDKPHEMAWLASHARIYLEEVFNAGHPVDERPRDGSGIAWAELNCIGPDRLPPRSDAGTAS